MDRYDNPEDRYISLIKVLRMMLAKHVNCTFPGGWNSSLSTLISSGSCPAMSKLIPCLTAAHSTKRSDDERQTRKTCKTIIKARQLRHIPVGFPSMLRSNISR